MVRLVSDESGETPPTRSLNCKLSADNPVSALNDDGIVPVSELSDRSRLNNDVQSPSADGIVPV